MAQLNWLRVSISWSELSFNKQGNIFQKFRTSKYPSPVQLILAVHLFFYTKFGHGSNAVCVHLRLSRFCLKIRSKLDVFMLALNGKLTVVPTVVPQWHNFSSSLAFCVVQLFLRSKFFCISEEFVNICCFLSSDVANFWTF
jgi:hypothetical protein